MLSYRLSYSCCILLRPYVGNHQVAMHSQCNRPVKPKMWTYRLWRHHVKCNALPFQDSQPSGVLVLLTVMFMVHYHVLRAHQDQWGRFLNQSQHASKWNMNSKSPEGTFPITVTASSAAIHRRRACVIINKRSFHVFVTVNRKKINKNRYVVNFWMVATLTLWMPRLNVSCEFQTEYVASYYGHFL